MNIHFYFPFAFVFWQIIFYLKILNLKDEYNYFYSPRPDIFFLKLQLQQFSL